MAFSKGIPVWECACLPDNDTYYDEEGEKCRKCGKYRKRLPKDKE